MVIFIAIVAGASVIGVACSMRKTRRVRPGGRAYADKAKLATVLVLSSALYNYEAGRR
jgi:hypothetical protein